MSSTPPHRIDPPSTAVPRIAGGRLASTRPPAAVSGRGLDGDATISPGDTDHRVDGPHHDDWRHSGDGQPDPTHLPDPEQWLRLLAADLIDRLQAWASDLDAREAQLNARASLQDHRERRFRLRRQDAEIELAEQQRSMDRLRREIKAHARRLAFSADCPPKQALQDV